MVEDVATNKSCSPGTSETSILLIEDHTSYRDGLKRMIETMTVHRCAGAYSTLEDALEAIDSGVHADVIFLDLGLPGMAGIEGILPLRERLPEVRVIVLTAFTNREKVFAALEAGAHGYLIKSTNSRRLIEVLDDVVAGGTPLDPQIAGMVLSTFQRLNPSSEEVDELSPRELEVLRLTASGHTRASIASAMDISTHTVTDYVRRIYQKLHVRSLPSAVAAAIRQGLLDFSQEE